MLVSVTYYFLVSFSLCLNQIVAKRNNFLKSETKEIVLDLPYPKILPYYWFSLERIINYANEHKTELDVGFRFGLFLVNENLKQFIVNISLPITLRASIKRIVEINDETLNFFSDGRDHYYENDVNLKISTFFKNSTPWMPLKKFDTNLQQGLEFHIDWHRQNYPDWKTYVSLVDDIDKWEPNPQQSDSCLSSLAGNEVNHSNLPRKCVFPEGCYNILNNGTNFGYALTHRLLFFLFAHFSRGCTITELDENMRHNLCEKMYSEAEYIGFNGYIHVDLMAEQIALCSLDGHAEFLHTPWINNLILYQTPHGCFGQSRPRSMYRNNIIESGELNWTHDHKNGTCNGHFTALAAASLASAVRFIVENLYFPS